MSNKLKIVLAVVVMLFGMANIASAAANTSIAGMIFPPQWCRTQFQAWQLAALQAGVTTNDGSPWRADSSVSTANVAKHTITFSKPWYNVCIISKVANAIGFKTIGRKGQTAYMQLPDSTIAIFPGPLYSLDLYPNDSTAAQTYYYFGFTEPPAQFTKNLQGRQ
jgi:hypothetical protein